MIKLIIVDDEEEIRDGIKSIIDWENNGICICGEAGNGREALDIIRKSAPDIALIDIRMPIMDGLQILEEIARESLPVKSIILSGYDDFAYAQKAIKLGASDYLLKPCRPQEILETVLKVRKLIENEAGRKEMLTRIKLQFAESLPLLKEKLLMRIIREEQVDTHRLWDKFRLFGMNLEDGKMAVIIIRIDRFPSVFDSLSNNDTELMKFAIKNIAEETLREKYRCEVFECSDDIVAVINPGIFPMDDADMQLLNRVKGNIRDHLGFTVSIGVGKSYDGIGFINRSYNEALSSINAKFFMGEDTIIRYEDICCGQLDETVYPFNEEKSVLNSLKIGDSKGYETSFEEYFNVIGRCGSSRSVYVKCCQALLMSVCHLCIETNISINEILGQNFTFLDEISTIDSVGQLKAEMHRVLDKAFHEVNSRRHCNKIVEMSLKFIDENYYKDLNLETVANHVLITPGYLSLLFKQSLGINFVDYLHKIRVEKACKELKDVRLKMYEVASRVGYNDEKYFCQIFKKLTGLTPTQFRETLI